MTMQAVINIQLSKLNVKYIFFKVEFAE